MADVVVAGHLIILVMEDGIAVSQTTVAATTTHFVIPIIFSTIISVVCQIVVLNPAHQIVAGE